MGWSFQCLTTGEGDFCLEYLTRRRAILPRNKEWIRVHFRMQEKVRLPFSLMAHKPWTRRDFKACLWFRRTIQRCRHFCKVIFLASNQNGVSLLLLMFFFPFVFCLLTDICCHAKQVFLCKRTCPVCVSPSSLLRTQMSSVIKNPVNFWKETDGYPTRT